MHVTTKEGDNILTFLDPFLIIKAYLKVTYGVLRVYSKVILLLYTVLRIANIASWGCDENSINSIMMNKKNKVV